MNDENDKSFTKEYSDAVKQKMLEKVRGTDKHHHDAEALRNWRAWGSWFSWGSPVGMAIFLIGIGVFLVLLHYAGIIGK